jgi:hypothetical protein
MPTTPAIPTKIEALRRDYAALGVIIKTFEDKYPDLLLRGVKRNFGEFEGQNQDLAPIMTEYRQLLDRRRSMEDEIRKLEDTSTVDETSAAIPFRLGSTY